MRRLGVQASQKALKEPCPSLGDGNGLENRKCIKALEGSNPSGSVNGSYGEDG